MTLSDSQLITSEEVLKAIEQGFREDVRPLWEKWPRGIRIARVLTVKDSSDG